MLAIPAFFTSGEVQRLVGISQRQLAHWDGSSLVRPHGRSASGRGSRRLYTLLDVILLKIIYRLRCAGVSIQRVRKALDCLRDLPGEPAPLTELEILTDGHRIIVRRSDEELLDPVARQYLLRLPLGVLLDEVRRDFSVEPGNDVLDQLKLSDRETERC